MSASHQTEGGKLFLIHSQLGAGNSVPFSFAILLTRYIDEQEKTKETKASAFFQASNASRWNHTNRFTTEIEKCEELRQSTVSGILDAFC